MIRYLLKKKLLIVLSNTRTFLSLFLANSLFGIVALKKKKTREAHASSFTGIGKSPTILKTWSRFPFGCVPTKFRVDQKHKSLRLPFRARKFIYFFFFEKEETPRNILSTRVSLYESGKFGAERRQDFPQILNYHACNICSWKKKCCTVRFFGRSIMNLKSKILDQDSVIVSFRYEWRVDQ